MNSLIGDSIFKSWQQSWSWEMGWHIVGWTMLYFLAAGTVLLAMLWFARLVLSAAQPKIRYATTLFGFAVLALLPIGIAGWLAIEMASPLRERGELTTPAFPEIVTNDTNEILNAEFAKSAEVVEKDLFFAEDRVNDQAISVTQADSMSLESVLHSSVDYLPWVWVIGTPLTFLLLATGLVGADRLRRSCRVLSEGPIHEACEQLRIALGIGRDVGIAICDSLATPLLVGVVRPLILLPSAALLGWPPEQLEMVLLHELAHVRRWDNAVNLAQRIVESVLFFHPAVWIVSNWVRRDREDCCDAVVVGHTSKPQAYAELLVALAANQPLAGLAASALARHPLASRIRRILKLEDEPMLVSRKGLMLGASAVMAIVLCVIFLARSEAEEATASPITNKSSRERPELSEATTKNSNDTKEDLTTEDTESTEIIGVTHERVYKLVPVGVEDSPLWEETQRTIIKSHSVLSRVIDDPEISKLPLMKHAKPNPLAWLSEQLMVTFTQEGQMLLGLTGPTRDKEELKEVAQAVVRSYLDERKKLQAQHDSLFPTLEEQKAADFAYKLLGVELEKLSEDEMTRVKAKGYKGGLRVAQTSAVASNQMPRGDAWLPGDLLVGLHVWPTESLEQVQEILSRFDINELTPLKFHVVRPSTDSVVTGRVAVDLEAWAEKEGFKQKILRQPEEKPATSSGKEKRALTLREAEIHHELAVKNYEQSLQANQNTPGSIPQFELRELKAAADLAQVEVERQRFQLNSLKRQIQKELVEKENERKKTIGNERTPERAMLDAEIEQLQEIAITMERRMSKLTAPEKGTSTNSSLTPLYDGKTFEAWKQAWRNDLSIDFRIKAVHAFVAFANTDQGKEAIDEILAIAEEYDWASIGKNQLTKPLQRACVAVFEEEQVPTDLAIQSISSAEIAKRPRLMQFIEYVIQPLSQSSKVANETLRVALPNQKIPKYVEPEKRGLGGGGGVF